MWKNICWEIQFENCLNNVNVDGVHYKVENTVNILNLIRTKNCGECKEKIETIVLILCHSCIGTQRFALSLCLSIVVVLVSTF